MVERKAKRKVKVVTQQALHFTVPIEDFDMIADQAAKRKVAMAVIGREMVAAHCGKSREQA